MFFIHLILMIRNIMAIFLNAFYFMKAYYQLEWTLSQFYLILSQNFTFYKIGIDLV